MEVEDRRKNVKNTSYSQMVAQDKAKGKKKIELLRKKRLDKTKKELLKTKKDGPKLTPAKIKSLEIYGFSKDRIKLLGLDTNKISDYRNIVKNQARDVKKVDATKQKKYKDKIEKIAKLKNTIQKAAGGANKTSDELVAKSKAGKDEAWKKYTSISAARNANPPSLYYSKNGKKMAAVTKTMMKSAGFKSFGAKSLTKYMNEQLRKKKKK
tara:strand:- start:363 stop:992 length:630 start_codon:yes stop_codon:yes gene_type:complete